MDLVGTRLLYFDDYMYTAFVLFTSYILYISHRFNLPIKKIYSLFTEGKK